MGIEDFAKKLDFCNGEQITQRYRDYCAQNAGETMYNDFVKNEAEAAQQAAGQFYKYGELNSEDTKHHQKDNS